MVTPTRAAERKAQGLNRTRARQMRKQPVSAEKLFWSAVRNRKLGGYKFRRQYPVGPYIADFVCLEKKLIVELDGPLHDAEYDAARDAYLRKAGFRVLRMKNGEFGWDVGSALASVLHALNSPSPNPLPRMRGGEGNN